MCTGVFADCLTSLGLEVIYISACAIKERLAIFRILRVFSAVCEYFRIVSTYRIDILAKLHTLVTKIHSQAQLSCIFVNQILYRARRGMKAVRSLGKPSPILPETPRRHRAKWRHSCCSRLVAAGVTDRMNEAREEVLTVGGDR